VRALFVLIRRQVIDNAGCFAVAAGVSLALTVSVVSVVLAESLDNLSSYAVTLILVGPVIIGIGSFILGVVQTYSDRTHGITAMLSTLPEGHTRILLARFITGAIIIVTALAPLAVAGTILWRLLGPPEWLFRGWIADLFVGLSLTGVASYCLGLCAGQNAQTFTSALRSLPLVPVLVLLIVVKGLGWPLLAVLLPLLAALLLRFHAHPARNFMRTITTGLMVLVLFAVSLCLARHSCDGLLMGHIQAHIGVSPSGLLPPEIENDPNVQDHSSVSAYVRSQYSYHRPIGRLFRFHWELSRLADRFDLIEELGLLKYFESRERGRRRMYSVPNRDPYSYDRIHVDEVGGQLICHRAVSDSWADEFAWDWAGVIELRAGPGGVSSSKDGNIGRFESPVVYVGPPSRPFRTQPNILVYDRKTLSFYSVDFKRQTVERRPQQQDSSARLINLGTSKGSDLLGAGFRLTYGLANFRVNVMNPLYSGHLPVVHESGRIDLLDPDTLELRGPIGCLPEPRTLFGKGSPHPRDLLDYVVSPGRLWRLSTRTATRSEAIPLKRASSTNLGARY